MSTKVKVKNDPPKTPSSLGEWYTLHEDKCQRKPWHEGRVGDYHVHRCGCGEKTFVTVPNHPMGKAAPLSIKSG